MNHDENFSVSIFFFQFPKVSSCYVDQKYLAYAILKIHFYEKLQLVDKQDKN
jgi:hypothetical protein